MPSPTSTAETQQTQSVARSCDGCGSTTRATRTMRYRLVDDPAEVERRYCSRCAFEPHRIVIAFTSPIQWPESKGTDRD